MSHLFHPKIDWLVDVFASISGYHQYANRFAVDVGILPPARLVRIGISKRRGMNMKTYGELAQAFVVAGLLRQADVGAAAGILADTLVIDEAKEAAAAAIADMYDQEDVKLEAAVWAEEDSTAGDWDAVDDDADIIDKAEEKELADQDILTAAGDEIAATFSDATAALIAARLVDETDYDAAVELIRDIWVVDVNKE